MTGGFVPGQLYCFYAVTDDAYEIRVVSYLGAY